jgi:hypothetical protein
LVQTFASLEDAPVTCVPSLYPPLKIPYNFC